MLRVPERAYAADGMTGQVFHILGSEHLCLHPEEMFEFTVINLHISGCYDEDRTILFFCVKG